MANVKGTIVDALTRAEVERRLDDIPMANEGVFYQVRAKEKLHVGDFVTVRLFRDLDANAEEAGTVERYVFDPVTNNIFMDGDARFFRIVWRNVEEGDRMTFHADGNTPDFLASVAAIVRSVGGLLGFDGEDLSGFALQMTEVCERGK